VLPVHKVLTAPHWKAGTTWLPLGVVVECA
jgi:hypothetical protein